MFKMINLFYAYFTTVFKKEKKVTRISISVCVEMCEIILVALKRYPYMQSAKKLAVALAASEKKLATSGKHSLDLPHPKLKKELPPWESVPWR